MSSSRRILDTTLKISETAPLLRRGHAPQHARTSPNAVLPQNLESTHVPRPTLQPRVTTPLTTGLQRPVGDFGISLSMYQIAGRKCGQSDWTEAATRGSVPEPGNALDGFDHFEVYLDRIKAMGCTTVRLSVEWCHVSPQQGQYDENVLARYEEILLACRTRELKPMVTLLHFAEPLWFANLGGFEKADNIPLFVAHCEVIFKRFAHLVPFWCTINEPAVRAFMGYVYAAYPPNKVNPWLATTVLNNQLKAHVDVYTALKGRGCKIGLVHNMLRFMPYHDKGVFRAIEKRLGDWMTDRTNDRVIDFLRSGKAGDVTDTRPKGDFFALNFYGNALIKIGKNAMNGIIGPASRPGQPQSKMWVPLDPKGFAEALDVAGSFDMPVYVTEFGYADEKGQDLNRTRCIEEYIAVADNKVAEGIPIEMMYAWTAQQGYEWHFKEGVADLGLMNADGSMRGSGRLFERRIAEARAAGELRPFTE